NRHAIRRREEHLLWLEQRRCGKVGGDGRRRNVPRRGRAEEDRRTRRLTGVRVEERDGLAVAGYHRRPLESRAPRQRDGRSAGYRDSPHVPAVDVVLVRVVDDRGPVRAERAVLDFERTPPEQG